MPCFLKKMMKLCRETASEKSINLPAGTRFSSVWSGARENISAGTFVIWVNNKGLMDQLIINITDDSEEMALITSVFLAKIRIENQVMSLDECGGPDSCVQESMFYDVNL